MTSPAGDVAVSTGRLDEVGGLSIYALADESANFVRLDESAIHTVVGPTNGDAFAVTHLRQDSTRFCIHSFESLREPLATCEVRDGTPTFEGDLGAWDLLPRVWTAPQGATHGLPSSFFKAFPEEKDVQPIELPWFVSDGDSWPSRLTQVPDQPLGLVTFHRAKTPVLIEMDRGSFVRELNLAGRYGGSSPRFSPTRHELWMSDYDTLVRVDTRKWKVAGQLLLERERDVSEEYPLQEKMTARAFIGSTALSVHRSLCAVARPFSGDVALIDMDSMRLLKTVPVGKQPMSVGFLADDHLLVRDWKDGSFTLATY